MSTPSTDMHVIGPPTSILYQLAWSREKARMGGAPYKPAKVGGGRSFRCLHI